MNQRKTISNPNMSLDHPYSGEIQFWKKKESSENKIHSKTGKGCGGSPFLKELEELEIFPRTLVQCARYNRARKGGLPTRYQGLSRQQQEGCGRRLPCRHGDASHFGGSKVRRGGAERGGGLLQVQIPRNKWWALDRSTCAGRMSLQKTERQKKTGGEEKRESANEDDCG